MILKAAALNKVSSALKSTLRGAEIVMQERRKSVGSTKQRCQVQLKTRTVGIDDPTFRSTYLVVVLMVAPRAVRRLKWHQLPQISAYCYAVVAKARLVAVVQALCSSAIRITKLRISLIGN